MRYFGGLDLSMGADPTALSIVELVDTRRGRLPILHLRHLQLFEDKNLGTLTDALSETLSRPLPEGQLDLTVDVTGVGCAMADLLAQAGLKFRCVRLHGGHNERHEDRSPAHIYSVPKRDVVGYLEATFRDKRIKIASGLEHAEDLEAALNAYKVLVGFSGEYRYKPPKNGFLVESTALACWAAHRFGIPQEPVAEAAS